MILILLLFIILAWRLLNNTSRINGAAKSRQSLVPETPAAIDILKERYARGEIDRATYHAMRREVA